MLKAELASLDEKIQRQKIERDTLADFYQTYKRDVEENPYEEICRQLEAEQQVQQAERERREENYKNQKER